LHTFDFDYAAPGVSMPLAQLILALAVDNGHPGRSTYSFEPIVECGTDPAHALCALNAPCEGGGPSCQPPRWSAQRGAWIRMETRDTALHRFAKVTKALSATAVRLNECKSPQGTALTSCVPVEWPGTTRDLALAALTVTLHESAFREDIQFGRPPLGRGPRGEACVMQVAPDQAVRNAGWLDDKERNYLMTHPRERERFAQSLLGDSPEALDRCFETGMRMLARARRSCSAGGTSWDSGMFSMYGGGKSCRVPGIGTTRAKTFRQLTTSHPTPARELEKLLD
jgi:hypothetical protein